MSCGDRVNSNSELKFDTAAVGEGESVVMGLLGANESMYNEMSLRCTSGEAEYQNGCMTPRVSSPSLASSASEGGRR